MPKPISTLAVPLAAVLAAVLLAATPLAAQVAGVQSASLPTAAEPATNGGIPVDRVVAIVGDSAILWSDVMELVNQRRAQGMPMPPDSAGQMALARRVLDELIDEELLVQKAVTEKVEVSENEITGRVDEQVKRIRAQFPTDEAYRTELRRAGFGSPDEHRRWLADQARRSQLQQQVIAKLRQDGKLVTLAVSEADVTEAFEKNRAALPRRPATVTFRQLVIEPKPSQAAKDAARAKAESLLVEIRAGGDFEQIAKRESMDPGSREVGGDLGWNRRGTMVPEFDRLMFALRPGSVSEVFETSFGFHIMRVDRVQPSEVKARHILITPKLDSSDVVRARAQADTAAQLWRGGASFDSLVTKYHDATENTVIPEPFVRDSLPESYGTAFEGQQAGAITAPFPIPNPRTGFPKFVVAQLLTVTEAGDYTVADLRQQIREQLAQERSFRRLLDQLRKETYVSVRL